MDLAARRAAPTARLLAVCMTGDGPERRMTSAELRVGTDLVDVREVAAALERFGERYVTRIFTADEASYCRRDPAAVAARFAARFAAKEATVKVLRPRGEWPDWRSIEVRRAPEGWCTIALHGRAAELAAEAGLAGFAVSLSHEASYATAVVVARRDGRTGEDG
jgi:holo-[acyl-carrier protein] synthase